MDILGYAQVTQAAAATLKSGPTKFGGFTVVASTGASITIYDNTSASGTVLFTKASLAVGDTVDLGSKVIAAKNGLHVVVGGTGTINVFYA